MTPVGYERALSLMLRTASGKASVSRLVNGIDVGESHAFELFAEMVRRGHAQHLPGVWGGDWYELTERGIVAAAWVVCRDHVGLDAENVRDRNVELRLADDDAPSPTALQPIEGLRASDWLVDADDQPNVNHAKRCDHPNIKRPDFDAKAARGLSVAEVRKRWPRVRELCPELRARRLVMTCDDIILVCRLHPRCETYDSAIRPHDRPADGRRGALTCVAMHDPAKRRGLWFRVKDEGDGHLIEFFAGREGDDDYFSVRTGEVFDERDTADALGVLASARWGYELGHESDYYGDASARESEFAPHFGGYCGETTERCGVAA